MLIDFFRRFGSLLFYFIPYAYLFSIVFYEFSSTSWFLSQTFDNLIGFIQDVQLPSHETAAVPVYEAK